MVRIIELSGEARFEMVSVHDVAAYILQKVGHSISTWKLQKLVYYSQAWSLVWDDRPMFGEPIQAWANGPVVPALYEAHRGQFDISSCPQGNPDRLDIDAKETVDAVLDGYGDKSGQWLSDLTHQERPWRDARVGVPDGERSTNEITLLAMSEYYSGLVKGNTVSVKTENG
jgi:uncharacterized phage-associated protein